MFIAEASQLGKTFQSLGQTTWTGVKKIFYRKYR